MRTSSRSRQNLHLYFALISLLPFQLQIHSQVSLHLFEHIPTIRCLKHISSHRLTESLLILLRTRHRRPILITPCKPAVFDPRLKLLVPRVGADAIDDAYDELLAFLVDRHHQAIVHDVLPREEERIVVHTAFEDSLGVLAGEKRGFIDELDHVFVEKDFVALACALDLAVAHGALKVEYPCGRSVVEKILHDKQEPIVLNSCDRILDNNL